MRYPVKQVLVIRKDLNMRKGKIGAQTAHVTSAFMMAGREPNTYEFKVSLSDEQVLWLDADYPKIVLYVNSQEELESLIAKAKELGITCHHVVDRGFTEFKGVPTLTCAAFGPHYVDRFEGFTDHLKPL